MRKIELINLTITEYFKLNPTIEIIPAKDMMPYFIKAGVFLKDERDGLPIRKILRSLDEKKQLGQIPYIVAERKQVNTNWFFSPHKGSSITKSMITRKHTKIKSTTAVEKTYRIDSDETYVLSLCDEILNLKGERQHRFDFLRGDAGTRLPVDIYYNELDLVIEYKEIQHTGTIAHFDKPNIMTVSGVHRGKQREIYDSRRKDVLPKHGIDLIEISYNDFNHNKRNVILRDKEADKSKIATMLTQFLKKK